MDYEEIERLKRSKGTTTPRITPQDIVLSRGGLLCFECVVEAPGDEYRAVTMKDGTALCEEHARATSEIGSQEL